MKYPVWIKLKESGRVLEAIDYTAMSDCYICMDNGKRELISPFDESLLYSRDKKTWLTYEELHDLDNPKTNYPEGSAMYCIEKYMTEAFDEVFKKG